jgi:uncharacterized protein YegL
MPRFGESTSQAITGLQFSAVDLKDLGATEYTLVGIVADRSGSTALFQTEMESCIGEIVSACRKSPRADNLLLRVTTFDSRLAEVHGFRPLPDCNPDDYKDSMPPGGLTALYDAAVNAVESVIRQGKELVDNDYSANGIVFVITDGANNTGTFTANTVKETIARAVQSESLESIITILVGVNVSVADPYLSDFAKEAGFTPVPVEDPSTGNPVLDANGDPKTVPFVALADASAKTLARLARFVSRSISSQSGAIGTGGPSQSLSF